jgi:hypothetical protein
LLQITRVKACKSQSTEGQAFFLAVTDVPHNREGLFAIFDCFPWLPQSIVRIPEIAQTMSYSLAISYLVGDS